MTKPIAFIIGAGKKVGASTAQALQSKGYRVAQAARSVKPEDSTDDSLLLTTNLVKPETLSSAFSKLRSTWGDPSVVVYNAAATHFTKPDEVVSVTQADFAADLTINTTSVYVAAQEAVAGFERLPASAAKVFLYTGNALNETSIPGLTTLGVGKSASAYLIQALSESYAGKGYRFYYVDERTPEGGPKFKGTDGPAHAEIFMELIEGAVEAPWLVTFAAGVGYKVFPKL